VAYGGGYPTLRDVRVWRIGDVAPLVIFSAAAGEDEIENVHVAAVPDGRLWVSWSQGTTIRAARSNTEATVFGSAASTEAPPVTQSIHTLTADAQAAVLDLVANVMVAAGGSDDGIALWHSQIRPGLTITPSRPFVPLRGAKIVFTITDAGVPLTGVRVQAGKKSGLTGADGKATVRVKGGNRGKKREITATLEGYEQATLVMVVGKPKNK
jgi:hypothetical protein